MSDEETKTPEIVSPAVAEARERLATVTAQLEERRAKEKAEKTERDEIEKAELASAILKHGEVGDGIAWIGTQAGIVIVHRPTEARWRQAERDSESRDPARLAESGKKLILDHLVYPNDQAYFKIAARYPAIPATLIDVIHNLARGGARALSGE